MKLILGLFTVLLAIALVWKFYGDYFKNNPLPFMKTSTVTISNHQFKVTIAKTPQDKQTGLSDKKTLPQDYGMLFPFDTADYFPFWMKNMQFPIDIIYINNNKIVTIFQNVQPPKSKEESLPILKPTEPANNVLEINAGLSQKYNFQTGNQVTIEQ